MDFFAFWCVIVTAFSTRGIMGQNENLDEVSEVNHVNSPPFYVNSGIPGLDFPNFTQIPYGIRFSCRDKVPGFYANPQTDCQVYHQCVEDGRSYSFLCGIGTIFNQRALTCDHWYNYECQNAEKDYETNLILFGNEENTQEITRK